MKNKKNIKTLKVEKLTISNLSKNSIKGGGRPGDDRKSEVYTCTQCHTNDHC